MRSDVQELLDKYQHSLAQAQGDLRDLLDRLTPTTNKKEYDEDFLLLEVLVSGPEYLTRQVFLKRTDFVKFKYQNG